MQIFDEVFLGMLSEMEETVLLTYRLNVEGTIAVKEVKGKKYAYLQRKKNGRWFYQYLGPLENENVKKLVESLKKQKSLLAEQKKRIKFFIQLLKGAGVIPVSGLLEKVIEKLSRNGVIFGKGILVGTLAFLSYQTKLGFSATEKSGKTGDIDIIGTKEIKFIAENSHDDVNVWNILEELEKEFVPESPLVGKLPVRLVHPSGLRIEFLHPHKAGIPGKVVNKEKTGFDGVGAIELPYLDFLVEEPVTGILAGSKSLYPVTVPAPEKFTAHKLIIAGKRKEIDKAVKDITQIEILLKTMKKRGMLSFVGEELKKYFKKYKKSLKYFKRSLEILKNREKIDKNIIQFLNTFDRNSSSPNITNKI